MSEVGGRGMAAVGDVEVTRIVVGVVAIVFSHNVIKLLRFLSFYLCSFFGVCVLGMGDPLCKSFFS